MIRSASPTRKPERRTNVYFTQGKLRQGERLDPAAYAKMLEKALEVASARIGRGIKYMRVRHVARKTKRERRRYHVTVGEVSRG